MATEPLTRVEIDVFSGRPNPGWTLGAAAVAELRAKLNELPREPQPSPVAAPQLGFRGFVIQRADSSGVMRPWLRVAGGACTDVADAAAAARQDTAGIEAWLVELAQREGFGALLSSARGGESAYTTQSRSDKMRSDDPTSHTPNERRGDGSKFVAAITRFQTELQRTWPSPQAQQSVAEAFERYQATLREGFEGHDVSARAATDFAEYMHRVREAFGGGEACERVAAAFRRYADDVQEAWSTLNPALLTPENMSGILGGMSWVTGIAETARRKGEGEGEL
ncbi:MAG: hypothetical protein GY711_32880 [bacterium]|nr:hypothetical protein [bacterium]